MTPELLAQHLAHKARQHRFAVAAQVKLRPVPITVQHCISAPIAEPEPVSLRRQYETPASASSFVPITRRILNAVASEFKYPVRDIIGPRRLKKYTIPRFVIVGLMLDLTNMSLPAIGRRLGGRDHTTILHSRNCLKKLLQDEAFRNRFDQIKAGLAS